MLVGEELQAERERERERGTAVWRRTIRILHKHNVQSQNLANKSLLIDLLGKQQYRIHWVLFLVMHWNPTGHQHWLSWICLFVMLNFVEQWMTRLVRMRYSSLVASNISSWQGAAFGQFNTGKRREYSAPFVAAAAAQPSQPSQCAEFEVLWRTVVVHCSLHRRHHLLVIDSESDAGQRQSACCAATTCKPAFGHAMQTRRWWW